MLFKDFVKINPKVDLKKGNTYPYVGMADVNPSRGYVTNSETREYKNSRSRFKEGDTLFARITPCLENGKITRFKSHGIKKGFGSTEFFVFRAKEGVSDPDYIYYLSRSPLIRKTAEKSMAGASGRQRADITAVEEVEIDPPDLPTQQKVASILNAYDDLIENNSRRIEILEEMARRIYREWFVQFRYPGHEDDELVDTGTNLGEIPGGWEVQPIDEVIDAMGGGTPKTEVDDYWEGGDITWFTPSDLTSSGQLYMSDSDRKITDEGLNNSSAKMFPPYSVMMTSRATLGVIAFNTVPASVNQGFIVCIPNEEVSAYQIYFWLQEKLPSMIKQASGATYKEIRKTDFRKMNFPVIEENLQEEFVAKVDPLFKKIENIEKKNEKLKETRELLLPKLISGKIDVEEMEISNSIDVL